MMRKAKGKVGITSKENKMQYFVLKTQYQYKDIAKSIPTAKWDSKRKMWKYQVSPEIFRQIVTRFNIQNGFMKDFMPYNEPKAKDIPNLKTESWKHQKLGYDFAYNNHCAMLAYDMGTGKTLIGVALARNVPDIKFTLVVCPKAVIPTWEEETINHIADDKLIPVGLLDGSVKDRTKQLKSARKYNNRIIVSINYEAIIYEPMKQYLYDNPPDMLILDESHRAKSPGGKQSWTLTHLAKRCRRRYGFTGTPMPNNCMDLYAQFRIIDPGYFGTSYDNFKYQYGFWGGYEGRQFLKPKNLEMLTDKFHKTALVAKTDEVLDLPKFIETKRYTNLNKRSMKHYDEVKDDLITMIEREKQENGVVSIDNALVKVIRLQQIVSGFVNDDDDTIHKLGDEKQKLFKDVMQDISKDERVVVFCKFHKELDDVKQLVGKNDDRHYYELSGRTNELKTWRLDRHGVLGVQYQAGSEGVSFVESKYVIYYTPTYSYGNYKQSYRRLVRPGQNRSVDAIFLIARGTIDLQVLSALERKEDAIEIIIDNLV